MCSYDNIPSPQSNLNQNGRFGNIIQACFWCTLKARRASSIKNIPLRLFQSPCPFHILRARTQIAARERDHSRGQPMSPIPALLCEPEVSRTLFFESCRRQAEKIREQTASAPLNGGKHDGTGPAEFPQCGSGAVLPGASGD